VRAHHLPLLTTVSAPTVHSDYAVVAVTRPDFAADAYVGQLWRVPVDGRPARRITRGFVDTSPKLSPDGSLLAFLRGSAEAPPQLALASADGGEPMVITDAELGVREFAFSPDGKRLAFIAQVPEPGRYGTVKDVGPGREDPRHITTVQFQLNGVGYTVDRRAHVFVVDVPDPYGEPPVKPIGNAAKADVDFVAVPVATQLSSGDFDHHAPTWDGDTVIVVAARHETRDGDLREDLYRFESPDAAPVRLTAAESTVGVIGSPVVVGDEMFFIGGDLGASGLDFFGHNPGVFAIPRSGGSARRLTAADSVHVDGQLVADGDGVLAVNLVRGVGRAIRVAASGMVELDGSMAELDEASVLAIGAAAGRRMAVVASADSPGELVDLARPDVPLTDFAAALRAASAPLRPVELEAKSADGYPVHGWVFAPPTSGPHPVLLMIHGGPFSAYGPTFFDEAQVLAEAGYAVLMCNPRGSASYGEAHAAAIKHDFGNLDAADVLAFLDHALATVSGLDADRVGIMGGSYGGYLTAWLIANEHRFAAAIVERAYLDPKTFVGASDIGWYFPAAIHGEDVRSPLLVVDQVRTPTLVIHSENDLRCPLAVALRYYTELKQRGVDAELLVFPGENHELSRSGSPLHRKARFEHILRWWDRHLPVVSA